MVFRTIVRRCIAQTLIILMPSGVQLHGSSLVNFHFNFIHVSRSFFKFTVSLSPCSVSFDMFLLLLFSFLFPSISTSFSFEHPIRWTNLICKWKNEQKTHTHKASSSNHSNINGFEQNKGLTWFRNWQNSPTSKISVYMDMIQWMCEMRTFVPYNIITMIPVRFCRHSSRA